MCRRVRAIWCVVSSGSYKKTERRAIKTGKRSKLPFWNKLRPLSPDSFWNRYCLATLVFQAPRSSDDTLGHSEKVQIQIHQQYAGFGSRYASCPFWRTAIHILVYLQISVTDCTASHHRIIALKLQLTHRIWYPNSLNALLPSFFSLSFCSFASFKVCAYKGRCHFQLQN